MRIVLAIVAICVVGCSSSPSSRCKDVCRREAECAEARDDPQFKVDQDECTSVCTALERDAEGKVIVDRHVTCVGAATSCEAVFACGGEEPAPPPLP